MFACLCFYLRHRHQRPEQRPNFSAVVDELLAIQESMPQQRATKHLASGSSGGDALDSLMG